jgi:GNAT superfamily N-acetyltransferase
LVAVLDIAAGRCGYTFVMGSHDVRTLEATAPEQLDDARRLFGEYASSLGWDLTSGWIAEELTTLPGSYAPPAGSLVVAYVDGKPAGALGLQPVPEPARFEDVDVSRAGELKRLFVRPEFRRHGVGRALMSRAEEEARARGYDALLLTTNIEMMPLAQHLYESLGYVETAPYRNDMPWPAIRWMRKQL